LSWHETDEKSPAFDQSGMLVYTRWDYIDRGFAAAHHIWHAYPDGNDSRAYHGNWPTGEGQMDDARMYNVADPLRSVSERAIRPIWGRAGLYMGLGSGHHCKSFGSLFVLDINSPDGRGDFRYFWPGTLANRDTYVNFGRFFAVLQAFFPATGNPARMYEGDEKRMRAHCGKDTMHMDPSRDAKMAQQQCWADPYPLDEDFALIGEFQQLYLVDRYRNKILILDGAPFLDVVQAAPAGDSRPGRRQRDGDVGRGGRLRCRLRVAGGDADHGPTHPATVSAAGTSLQHAGHPARRPRRRTWSGCPEHSGHGAGGGRRQRVLPCPG
jgi:hypothetical protein